MDDKLDEKEKQDAQDSNNVDVSQAHEVKYWTKKFKCTKKELVAAVEAVGTDKEAVAAYLGGEDQGKDDIGFEDAFCEEVAAETKETQFISTESKITEDKPSGNTTQKTPSKVSGNIVAA